MTGGSAGGGRVSRRTFVTERPDIPPIHDVPERARNRLAVRELLLSPDDDDPTGGARRDRTDDLMLAKHALSQLSYGPETRWCWWAWEDLNFRPHAYQARALTN
jgi:hypothetical protein